MGSAGWGAREGKDANKRAVGQTVSGLELLSRDGVQRKEECPRETDVRGIALLCFALLCFAPSWCALRCSRNAMRLAVFHVLLDCLPLLRRRASRRQRSFAEKGMTVAGAVMIHGPDA